MQIRLLVAHRCIAGAGPAAWAGAALGVMSGVIGGSALVVGVMSGGTVVLALGRESSRGETMMVRVTIMVTMMVMIIRCVADTPIF